MYYNYHSERNSVETVSYIDSEGDDVISTIEMMGLKFQFIAAEMEEALANEGVAEILADVSIKAPAGSPDPTKAKAVRYSLKFDKSNVSFYHDTHQLVASRSDRKITIEVKPEQPTGSQQLPKDVFDIEPEEAFNKSEYTALADEAGAGLIEAEKCFNPKNLWLSYNDPAIRKLAQQAIGDERDAWKAARKVDIFCT